MPKQVTDTFTMPGITAHFESGRANLGQGVEQLLVDFIKGAKTSIDFAIYDLRSPVILAALKSVSRKVKLRIAFDNAKKSVKGNPTVDPKISTTGKLIAAAGLKATPVQEASGHLMHDKFIVRDGRQVWMGTGNFTTGGLHLQDNSWLVLDSPQLAKLYTATFNGLMSGKHTHAIPATATTAAGVSGRSITVGTTPVSVFFAPADLEGVETAVIKALSTAKSVRILAFLMSDPGILAAVHRFQAAGDIRGVIDPNGMANSMKSKKISPAQFWFMKDNRFVKAPSHAFNPTKGEQDFMHNKVMILDGAVVIVGSYNFSENAEGNDENLLVIKSKPLATAYLAYFETLFKKYGGH